MNQSQHQLPVATLDAIISQTDTFSVQLEGRALAPAFHDGDVVTFRPAYRMDPSLLPAGTLVMASVPCDTFTQRVDRYPKMRTVVGTFLVNADRDLRFAGGHVSRGEYTILAVHVATLPANATRH